MEYVPKHLYDELLVENQLLREEIALLKQRNAEQEQEIASLKAQLQEVDELKALVAELNAKIAKLNKMLFGKKSERSKKDRDESAKDDASSAPPSNDGESVTPKPPRKRGGGGRNAIPKHIPRRDIRVSLPPDERCCATCGAEYESMGVEISEVLNAIPMIVEALRVIRERLKPVCSCSGNKIVIAEMPIRTIDRGSVTTEFVAALLVNKYGDHLPIHRQTKRMFTSMGIDISESSVCRWRDMAADQLEPLAELMKSEIKESHCINTDASPAPVRLPKEKNRIANGNLYVYIGGADRPYNIFDVQPNQSSKPIHDFLAGYSNRVQCDAHRNYDALFAPSVVDPKHPPPEEVGCHAHCRRHFVDAQDSEPEWVKRFVNLYKELYKIEKEIKELSTEERLHRRRSDSVPLLDTLFEWCRECSETPSILPKSPLGQACAYALNNESALRRYVSDARLNIDNNVSERTLREYVIGRKNWLFFGSVEAARGSAIIMSVLSSARRHGLNEWEYLVDVLHRLSDLPSLAAIRELLPDRWVKSSAPPTEAAAMTVR